MIWFDFKKIKPPEDGWYLIYIAGSQVIKHCGYVNGYFYKRGHDVWQASLRFGKHKDSFTNIYNQDPEWIGKPYLKVSHWSFLNSPHRPRNDYHDYINFDYSVNYLMIVVKSLQNIDAEITYTKSK